MTDDGDLLHRIISPRANVSKRYHVTLDRPLRGDEAEIFAAGTLLLEGEDKPLLPVPDGGAFQHQRLRDPAPRDATIRSGACSRPWATTSTALHRDRIGDLTLPVGSGAGQYRVLEEADLSLVLPPSKKA